MVVERAEDELSEVGITKVLLLAIHSGLVVILDITPGVVIVL